MWWTSSRRRSISTSWASVPRRSWRVIPRYSELALKTVQYAKDRGATIIGVTDSEMSPVYQMSSGSLLVRNEMISFVDSLAAPMSMLNALILAAAHKQGTDISATFNELEHVWDRFGIFGKVEDE